MKQFIEAARSAVRTRNWHGALGIALTLPDICGRLQNPAATTKDRYVEWWRTYAQPKYTHEIGPSRHEVVFLSGDDAYALRCAYLHEGGADIAFQKARQVLKDFLFIEPEQGIRLHCNKSNSTLQLQTDIFCSDICDGADGWLRDHGGEAEVKERIKLLLHIHNPKAGLAF